MPTDAQLQTAAIFTGARLTKLAIDVSHLYKDWPPPIEVLDKDWMSPATARSYRRALRILHDPEYDIDQWANE